MDKRPFKVGNKVRYISGCGSFEQGAVQVITSISDCKGYLRFNNELSGTHRSSFELASGQPYINKETGLRECIE